MVEVDECSFEACDRAARVRGLCAAHYQQWRLGQGMRPLRGKEPKRLCSFDGCDRVNRAKGLCQSHYAQKIAGKKLTPIEHRSNYGLPHIPGPDSRFEDRIDAGSSRNPESGCLIWRRALSASGSPVISVDGKSTVLSRLAFEHWFGVDPGSRHIKRVCGNKACLEPGHMLVHGYDLGAEPYLDPGVDAETLPIGDENDLWYVSYRIGGAEVRASHPMTKFEAGLYRQRFMGSKERVEPPIEDWRAWGKHLWHERVKGAIWTQCEPVR